MNHDDHVALIRRGVEGVGPRWLELGSGEGAFTLALADLLAYGGSIRAVDRDARALKVAVEAVAHRAPGIEVIAEAVAHRTPSIEVIAEVGDFTSGLPEGPFDGVLAANSLHFVRDRRRVLAAIRGVLRPGGPLIVVEYDADRGNPWVPHPFSFATWQREATAAGFADVKLLHRVPSRFLGAIYGSAATSPGPPGQR